MNEQGILHRLDAIEERLIAIEALLSQPHPPVAVDLAPVQAQLNDVLAAVLNVQVLLEA